eukprot:GSMAST32.ASY1.ANO1.2100.1 assembled CDS
MPVHGSMDAVRLSNGVEKSANDKCNYKVVVLENKLTCLLIQDEQTDKAAAALDVKVGHYSDPDNLPGLAHFTEHMLFLGTKKYPDENSYSAHLSSNGGMSNAFTGAESTNFHFHFFIAPLFTASATGRELKASDHWRLYQLSKSLARPDHPVHKFGTGNLETLKTIPEKEGVDVRSALLNFHAKHYSANLMKLCVIGRETLDVQEKWIREKFGKIKNSEISAPSFELNPYTDCFCKKVNIIPVKDLRYVRLTFVCPPVFFLKYFSTIHAISSAGSILSILKSKGWANELSAGTSSSQSCFSMFEVTVEVTEEGLQNVNGVCSVIFSYLKMLRTHGPDESVWEECKLLNEISLKFQSKRKPMSNCTTIAGHLQKYPAEFVLTGRSLFREFDSSLIQNFLNYLKPENSFVFVVSKLGVYNPNISLMKEKWYGTEHIKTNWEIGDEFISEVFMPKINPFLPEDLALYPLPNGIKKTYYIRLWYKQDGYFEVPKMAFCCRLLTPVAYESPEASVMVSLYQRMITDELTEFSYFAELAGLNYALSESWSGLELVLSGYNSKMSILLKKIVEKMKSFEISEKKGNIPRFISLKNKLKRGYEDFEMEAPYQHAMYCTRHALLNPQWHYRDKLAVIDDITHEQLLKCSRLFASQQPAPRSVRLDTKTVYYFEHKESNPEQCGMDCPVESINPSNISNTVLQLLMNIMNEPCYDQLRTKEQLGYLVWSGMATEWGVLGCQIIIQSDKATGEYLEDRILLFLKDFHTGDIDKNNPNHLKNAFNSFNLHKKSLAAQLSETPKTLNEESSKMWQQISGRTFLFNEKERDAAAVLNIVRFHNEFQNKKT